MCGEPHPLPLVGQSEAVASDLDEVARTIDLRFFGESDLGRMNRCESVRLARVATAVNRTRKGEKPPG